MEYVGGPSGQNLGNETALLVHDGGGSVMAGAGATACRRRGRPRREEARPDTPMGRTVALIAEIFAHDMLRLEREHGLNADQMLAYYKGELELDEEDKR